MYIFIPSYIGIRSDLLKGRFGLCYHIPERWWRCPLSMDVDGSFTEFVIQNSGVKQQHRVSIRSKNSNGLGPATKEFIFTSGG